jgi:hypothetical protein
MGRAHDATLHGPPDADQGQEDLADDLGEGPAGTRPGRSLGRLLCR